ncbi:MAG: class I SAM-dependent methyltransferase [Steroidobacteraceae bacterium]|nr:class I SAM-dependent methyltransferase [Steroidobacteraceae bacterium]
MQHALGQATHMSFKDHFSRQSAAYSRFRPAYPPGLIEFVATRAPGRRLAVDCATGNGQAAVALAAHFDTVLAVDGSSSQLARAQPHPRVHYAAGFAEQLPARDCSVDLVAAAQAAHWFDFARFHAECRRVLVPGGVVAVWTYEKFRVNDTIDAVIEDFYANVVGADWPPERSYVEQGYRTLPFPWRELQAPLFELETDWDLEQVMGYLATWSAVQRYQERVGQDPLAALRPRLAALWPLSTALRLRWPIHLRLGVA